MRGCEDIGGDVEKGRRGIEGVWVEVRDFESWVNFRCMMMGGWIKKLDEGMGLICFMFKML